MKRFIKWLFWDDYTDELNLFGIILGVILLIGSIVGAGVGITVANAHWNCSQWNKQPESINNPARYIAGSCYIRNSRGKLVEFSTYVNTTSNSYHINDGNE